jgi:hypothetical protein
MCELNQVTKRVLYEGEKLILEDEGVADFYFQFFVGEHWDLSENVVQEHIFEHTLRLISTSCSHPLLQPRVVHFLGKLALHCFVEKQT